GMSGVITVRTAPTPTTTAAPPAATTTRPPATTAPATTRATAATATPTTAAAAPVSTTAVTAPTSSTTSSTIAGQAAASTKDDGRYAVVASNGGADQPPGWLHNVQAQPKVEVQLGRTTQPATASVVERGDADYERLWRLVNANNGNRYDAYQRRTDRPIPIV